MTFEIEEQGYKLRAVKQGEGSQNHTVEIEKDGKVVKRIDWPSYKIWNVAAHAADIVEGLEEGSDDGLYLAGSDGLGGGCYG